MCLYPEKIYQEDMQKVRMPATVIKICFFFINVYSSVLFCVLLSPQGYLGKVKVLVLLLLIVNFNFTLRQSQMARISKLWETLIVQIHFPPAVNVFKFFL